MFPSRHIIAQQMISCLNSQARVHFLVQFGKSVCTDRWAGRALQEHMLQILESITGG